MDLRTLQERIDRVESKRALLIQYQADPSLRSLAIDIEQALIEMDDLKIEFRMVFPNGIVEPPIDRS
jgi:DNA-directed RNA polymerase subunit K/omega